MNCEDYITDYPSNHGVYVLLISSASELSGSAPMSSIPDNGGIICGKRDKVEGVRFRIVKMDLDGPAFEGLKEDTKEKLLEVSQLNDVASVSMFRNIVAHACFGTEEKEKFMIDPFGNNDISSYGAIDKLRSLEENAPNRIKDSDVPIALIRWTEEEIKFLDLWSVRRKPYGSVTRSNFSTLFSLRRRAEAESSFVQFQKQLDQLLINHNDKRSIKAEEHFRYLPPAGILSLRMGTSDGLVPETFFNKLPHRPAPEFIGSYEQFIEESPQFIDGRTTEEIVNKSFAHEPIVLSEKYATGFPPKLENREMVWTYYFWQHVKNIEHGEDITHYLLFTAGYMPPFSPTRFDFARWDFSNYTKCCS